MVNSMKNGDNIDYRDWKIKEVQSFRDRMIKAKWHKPSGSIINSYEQFVKDIEIKVIKNMRYNINRLITKEHWFKMFMLTHSLFLNDIKITKSNKDNPKIIELKDRLDKMVIVNNFDYIYGVEMIKNILEPTDMDIEFLKPELASGDKIFNMIVNKFDARIEKTLHFPIQLHIGFNGYNIINLYDESFDTKTINIKKEIQSYSVIKL